MKIGLNATCFDDRPSGAKQRFVGIYTYLIKRHPEIEFVIIEPKNCRVSQWFEKTPNISARISPLPSVGRLAKAFHGLMYWESVLNKERFDIFECFNLPIVKNHFGMTLLTIHDVRGIKPEFGLLQSLSYKLFLERSLKKADHIIAVSESMKQEILAILPSIKISIIYNGINKKEFNEISDLDKYSVRKKFSLPQKFILAVGHLEARKNFTTLIDAFNIIRNRGHQYNLVIIGNNSGKLKELKNQVNLLKLNEYVFFLSGINDYEVRCIYKLCSLFVFPSTYEGFGIPILEAMAANCPFILSDIPVFREITHNNTIYFPYYDVNLLVQALEDVISTEPIRSQLIKYGSQRVDDFSFPKIGELVSNLYTSLMIE
jgi:glycosyltransferase involved in cell wall biosynthesis